MKQFWIWIGDRTFYLKVAYGTINDYLVIADSEDILSVPNILEFHTYEKEE